jgi:hypothetical protein
MAKSHGTVTGYDFCRNGGCAQCNCLSSPEWMPPANSICPHCNHKHEHCQACKTAKSHKNAKRVRKDYGAGLRAASGNPGGSPRMRSRQAETVGGPRNDASMGTEPGSEPGEGSEAWAARMLSQFAEALGHCLINPGMCIAITGSAAEREATEKLAIEFADTREVDFDFEPNMESNGEPAIGVWIYPAGE